MLKWFLLPAALAAATIAHADVFRCLDGGTVLYTDQPCPNGEKVEIRNTMVGGTLANAAMVSVTSALARDRLIGDVTRTIRTRSERVAELRQSMQQDMAAIQQRKSWAGDDIEGALRQQSLSLEQAATAQKYEAQIQAEQRNIGLLVDELHRLD